ncbi:reducing type I polyketide synthase [Mollisia scopiformis]|uniref:Reducing type I polyketide synthase n=1 Tax=Mollisia scopiformis TaxID=149040 RepID=A0A132B6C4_MOLSC|nr:reducing type I polyketide synthase [Mollisia scopiformis]KUJ07891.1 reducing type I polyketide synthase [Mollisia scopiformis]
MEPDCFCYGEPQNTANNEKGTFVGMDTNTESSREASFEPIAIIGMAFKFPQGAESSDSFWRMLEEKHCAATTYPKERFDIDAFWHSDSTRQNIINPREAHFMKGNIGDFDAGFFSMTPQEVGAMDPQQRGLLETTYHAFENAGLALDNIAGSDTSVHIGCFTSDFSHLSLKDAQQIPKYAAVGSAGSVLANRLSWYFDLRGESVYLDTACSSGLIATALACEQLHSGKSKMAIAGAANIILNPEFNIALSNMNFLSPSGRCKSFDVKGDGYGRGEGYAALVLKRVSTALADGDPIRAVIRSVGTNQDGYTSGGITQPSKEMQAKLIKDTYRRAGLSLKHTRFFEAHGTGTTVGDPIEARAIGETFLQHRSEQDPIYVGAVKSNIGHLEGTSGIASIVKTVLALEHGVIPPNANFNQLNPQIDSEFLRLKFPTNCVPWPEGEIRRASVNSFGFGGANAHVVIDSAEGFLKGRECDTCQREVAVRSIPWSNQHPVHHTPRIFEENGFHHNSIELDKLLSRAHSNGVQNYDKSISENGFANEHNDYLGKLSIWPKLLVLSAADEDGLKRQAMTLSQFLQSHSRRWDPQFLYDVIEVFNTRRTLLSWKSYMVLDSASAFEMLESGLSKAVRRPTAPSSRRLGIVFTGQGAQWAGMGRELLQWPVFEKSIERSQKYLGMLGCGWNVVDEISKDAERSRINETQFSQTISTVLQIALVDLARHLCLNVSVVVGHSSGEIAAAYCAGFLSHQSAVRVAYFRGLLASELAESCGQKCGMLSVGVAASQMQQELSRIQSEQQGSGTLLADSITVSCINSPTNVTISGPLDSLDIIMTNLQARGIFARRLKIDLGYHSPQMSTIAKAYSAHLKDLRPGNVSCEIRMFSSVVLRIVSKEVVCTPSYWVQNMLSPVRFVEAMESCCSCPNEDSILHKLDLSHQAQIVTDGWLEVGPHAALKGPLREIFDLTNRSDNMFYASILMRNKSAVYTLLDTVGQLHCRNFQVDLGAIARMSGSPLRLTPGTISTLPSYPFNHSTVYWEESARSKGLRSRKHANNELLGAPVIDWNPLDARWRLVVKKEDMPWVEQHKVHGQMLYPAAGMLVMAIEGLKQLTEQKIIGYEIRDVSFVAPIVLNSSSDGTEIQTTLTPTSMQNIEAEYKFRILVKAGNDSWQAACFGTIAADTGRGSQDVNFCMEEEYKKQAARSKYEHAVQSCLTSIETAELYKRIRDNTGLEYGPMFQPLTEMSYSSDGQGCAQLLPCTGVSSKIRQPWTIHPSTLDGVFQFTYLGLGKGWSETVPTMVPSHLMRLWISTAGAGHADLGSEVSNSSSSFLSKRAAIGTATVFSEDDMSIRLEVEGLEVTEMGGTSVPEESTLQATCQYMEWKPDFSTMTTMEISEYCGEHRKDHAEPEEWFQELGLMMLSFTACTFDKLSKLQLHPIESQVRYVAWLQSRLDEYLSLAGPGAELDVLDSGKLEKMRQKFFGDSKRGNLSARTGGQLFQILTGEVNALDFIFEDEAFVSEYYHELNQTGKAFDMLSAYLDARAHKDPGLKYLEIGAGTGATTTQILGSIARPEIGTRYSEYHYTDISPYFITHATEKYDRFPRMKYLILNIEEDPTHQGFEQESYDIIIAANVLHATKNLSVTLANTRKLLKPNGQLIMMEMTTPMKIETGFVFGLLPGWWLSSEEYRRNGAIMLEEQWHSVLKEHGFSGCEQIFRDWDSDQCHGWSIIITSVSTPDVPILAIGVKGKTRSLTLVADMTSQIQTQIGEGLQHDLGDSGTSVDLISLRDLFLFADLRERDVVLLAGLEKCLLDETSQPAFQALQRILTSSKSILWVNNMGSAPDDAPYWAMTDGLTRVCRNEDISITMATLALEQSTCGNKDKVVQQIIKVVHQIHTGSSTDTMDLDWMEIQGRLCINRLSKADLVDKYVFSRTTKPVRMRQFGSSPPLKLQIKTPGLLDTIEWIEDGGAYLPLDPDYIEVRIQTVGVNFKECLTLLGRVNVDQLGSEAAGYVHRVGARVQRFKVGDRVAVATANTYQTLVRVRDAVHLPDSMSFVEAASLPTAFCTAYVSLIRTARLQKGETILIHAAAGGTGQAAVQLAQNLGAEVFVTVGSHGKKKIVMEQYNVPEDHIFYSRDSSFADGIKRMTGGRGVDVVLNSLSGKLLIASWESIAPFGRFIEIGRKDIDSRGQLPMYPFIKNTMFAGVDLAAYIMGEADNRGQEQMQEVFRMAEHHIIRPPYPLTTYSLDQAEDAFRMLQSGKNSGKMVLEVSNEAVVPVREGADGDYRFRPDATYVVAGGFGGIGRQITRWMARRGAQHILVLSRSTPEQNAEGGRMISELRLLEIDVQHASCDISDLASLQSSVQTAMTTRAMPRIEGCFQASMVLNDRPFSTMQYSEWNAAIRPKVHGSWNLHKTLPNQMDFFVMLSSVTGIVGNPGQSNYAAGNTFQDALARYRVSRGEKATALDLGIILGEGFVAENQDIHDKLVRLNMLDMISQERLFAMFDYFCDPSISNGTNAASQVVAGLTSPGMLLQRGSEVPLALRRSMFRAMHHVDSVQGQDDANGANEVLSSSLDVVKLFQESASVQDAGAMVAEALKAKVSKLVGVNVEEHTVDDRMESFGVDSLVALELRNWISKEMHADIAVYEILGDAKLSDIGLMVARKNQQPHWHEST